MTQKLQANKIRENWERVMRSDVNMSVSPFSDNDASAVIYKKIERLMTASYMVSDLLPDTEELKHVLRESVLSLLETALALRSGFDSKDVEVLKADLRKILSVIDVLFVLGLISEMNTAVLKEAYMNLASFLDAVTKSGSAEKVILKRDLFLDDEQIDLPSLKTESSVPQALKLSDLDAVQVADKQRADGSVLSKKESTESTVNMDEDNDFAVRSVTITTGKSRIQNTKQAILASSNKQKNKSVRTRARSGNRRAVILDLITKKGSVTIRDVADEITDCSTKTLQRELLSLVAEDILVKEGERRWTSYSLAR